MARAVPAIALGGFAIAPARDREQLAQQEAAVGLGDGPGASRVAEALGVDVGLGHHRFPPRRPRSQHGAHGPRARREPRSRTRAGQRHLVEERPRAGQGPPVHRQPRMRGVERQVLRDALGMRHAQQHRGHPAPVVADEPHALEPHGVQQREQIGCELLLLIPAARSLAPAVPAQVGGDDAEVGRERRDQVAPHPPVLRPAVDEEHRLALSRLGDVQLDRAGPHPPVLDPLQMGHVGRSHGAGPYRRTPQGHRLGTSTTGRRSVWPS